ncbi:MFS transporter [Peptoniphilus sp. oral taxon 386]|uniref:MFS transporter n=1 Tax=Peptoniphilus sp. oral taxon 386 TaxID=652713 RepID=UPI0002D2C982|nr:MFS transporter [Peptoniphilus sp. oral taxon 386]
MKKLTPLEKKWIFYDVGNSAFILLSTTMIPIVFNNLAEKFLDAATYLAYWGYGITISTIVVAILGPVLGAIADNKGRKNLLFSIFVMFGVISLSLMPFSKNYMLFLVLYVITKIGYNGSLIFYDSMLPDVTTDENMDKVSSYGFAWGYIGSCVPFIISIAIIFGKDKLHLSMSNAIIISFLLNAVWWLAFSLPLIKSYKQVHFLDTGVVGIKEVYSRLLFTLKEIFVDKKVFLFLLSFLFYIDGVYTIINMATAYGKSLGLSSNGLILALLVTQLVAFPCAIWFAHISKKYSTDKLLKICIIAYGLIALYAIQLDQLYEFWILAVAVGMFQGAIQALSRSYYVRIIPAERSGEYFGIYDICGKGASVFGTLLISIVSQITGQQNKAISLLLILFVIGYFIFDKASKVKQ